jgi:hypothetical protein
MNSDEDTPEQVRGGLPHSEIPGSPIARISPGLFAACRVLPRLSVPRHPPDALHLVRSRNAGQTLAKQANAWTTSRTPAAHRGKPQGQLPQGQLPSCQPAPRVAPKNRPAARRPSMKTLFGRQPADRARFASAPAGRSRHPPRSHSQTSLHPSINTAPAHPPGQHPLGCPPPAANPGTTPVFAKCPIQRSDENSKIR